MVTLVSLEEEGDPVVEQSKPIVGVGNRRGGSSRSAWFRGIFSSAVGARPSGWEADCVLDTMVYEPEFCA